VTAFNPTEENTAMTAAAKLQPSVVIPDSAHTDSPEDLLAALAQQTGVALKSPPIDAITAALSRIEAICIVLGQQLDGTSGERLSDLVLCNLAWTIQGLANEAMTAVTMPVATPVQLRAVASATPATKGITAAEQVADALRTADAISQGGFGKISGMASCAEAALDTNEPVVARFNVIQTLKAIASIADECLNDINVVAESVGCNHKD
jgi:hypothetical protein